MGPLLDAGHRCVVPDLPGFGRSDKLADDAWYSYDNHTAAIAFLFEELDLSNVTLVGHDWGGPIGPRAATTELPGRVSRIVAMDTRVLTGYQQMGEGWYDLRDSVAENPDVPVGHLVRGGCKEPPSPEAPFPDKASKAGVRAFPPMIPIEPDAPGAAAGQAVAEVLAKDTRPTLLLWADSDPVIPLGRLTQDVFPAAEELTVVENAGHFLQEDQGERIGTLVADWLATL